MINKIIKLVMFIKKIKPRALQNSDFLKISKELNRQIKKELERRREFSACNLYLNKIRSKQKITRRKFNKKVDDVLDRSALYNVPKSLRVEAFLMMGDITRKTLKGIYDVK
jgi:hypothetical protein